MIFIYFLEDFMINTRKSLYALTISLFITLPAFSAGFTAGDQFSVTSIEGSLNIQCSSGNESSNAATICRGEIFNPAEYSFFIGPKADADQVTLQAVHENGSVSKSKSSEYDALTGKSKKSFNLWITTLFQRPLLGFGKNTVNYSLTKKGTVVETGTFEANVTGGASSVCQRVGFYFSNNISDCTNPSTFCARYFSENNYCQ